MAGNKPDYRVSAIVRGNDSMKGTIGVAWKKDDGKISVKLNAFVQLNGDPDLFITLFPIDENGNSYSDDGGGSRRGGGRSRSRAADDEEIPF